MFTKGRLLDGSWISRLRVGALALLLGLPVLHTAYAQEVAEDEDPPNRVARLSYRQGDVTLEPAGSSEPETALLNRPLTTGDRLWADNGARAELQVGSATLHLDESTGIEFTEVGDDTLRVLLHDGALNVHVRDLGRDELLEIETPNALVTLDEPGEYRVEAAADNGVTLVKVREGASTVDGVERGSGTYRVDAGRQGIFTGSAPLSADIDRVDARTAFDRWSADREQRSARSPTSRYVSREVIGYEDLDDHGDWRDEADYGYVWYPRAIATGWAPYRYGQWVWVRPWGWTWVDSAPWGFAPFHYGRWAYVHDRWGWVPGPRRIRPVYAPALVAWVGGPSVSVSLSFGSGIGWFPLGPREVYVPGYRASHRHIRNVNVSNTVIVNNTYITNVYNTGGRDVRYVHRDRRDAITAVSRDDFTRGRPVDRNRIRWNDNDRGRVEANTLRPEGWRGDDRDQRNAPALVGRPDNPRSATARRESAEASAAERRVERNARPEVTRERDGGSSNWQQDRGRERPGSAPALSTQDSPPKETGRPRQNQPAVGVDKRDRIRSQVGGSDNEVRSYRQQTAPEAVRPDRESRESSPGASRVERPQYERRQPERRQSEEGGRLSGNPMRSERSRDRQPQATEAPRQDFSTRSDSRPAPQAREQRQPQPGNPSVDRNRREIAPQGQKEGQQRPGRPRQE